MRPPSERAAARALAARRLTGFDQVAALLWPTEDDSARGRRRRHGAMLIVPSTRRPRLAVPADHPSVAASVAMHHGDNAGRTAKLQRYLLAATLRSPVRRAVFELRGGSSSDVTPFLDHLSTVLGRPAIASFAITPARANRKPVLQLTDEHGSPFAFAKVGVNDVTRALVRHEADALQAVTEAELRQVSTPQVVHAGPWHDQYVLIVSSLPVRQGSAAQPAMISEAMREFATRLHVPETSAPLVDVLQHRVAHALARPLNAPDEDALRRMSQFLERCRSLLDEVPRGAWHGDWTPWNCRRHSTRLLLWDLERFERDVPLGLDAVHYFIQEAVAEGTSHARAAQAAVVRAPRILETWPLSDGQRRAVAALYLVTISLRYIQDGQNLAGGAGGDVSQWSLPALDAFAERADDA